MRANFVGTEFTLYDGGHKKGKKSKVPGQGERLELGWVVGTLPGDAEACMGVYWAARMPLPRCSMQPGHFLACSLRAPCVSQGMQALQL